MSQKGGAAAAAKGSTRRGQVKMRARPIDVNKSLQLIDTSESNEGLTDQPDIEITGLQQSSTERSGAIRAPAPSASAVSSADVTVGAKGKQEIPIPPVRVIPDYYTKKMRYPQY